MCCSCCAKRHQIFVISIQEGREEVLLIKFNKKWRQNRIERMKNSRKIKRDGCYRTFWRQQIESIIRVEAHRESFCLYCSYKEQWNWCWELEGKGVARPVLFLNTNFSRRISRSSRSSRRNHFYHDCNDCGTLLSCVMGVPLTKCGIERVESGKTEPIVHFLFG